MWTQAQITLIYVQVFILFINLMPSKSVDHDVQLSPVPDQAG